MTPPVHPDPPLQGTQQKGGNLVGLRAEREATLYRMSRAHNGYCFCIPIGGTREALN